MSILQSKVLHQCSVLVAQLDDLLLLLLRSEIFPVHNSTYQLLELSMHLAHILSGIYVIQSDGSVFAVRRYSRLRDGIQLLQDVYVSLWIVLGKLRSELLLASLCEGLVNEAPVLLRKRLLDYLSA